MRQKRKEIFAIAKSEFNLGTECSTYLIRFEEGRKYQLFLVYDTITNNKYYIIENDVTKDPYLNGRTYTKIITQIKISLEDIDNYFKIVESINLITYAEE